MYAYIKIISDSFDMITVGIAKNQALFEMENCKQVQNRCRLVPTAVEAACC